MSSLKFLAIGDLHIQPNNLKEIEDLSSKILNYVKKNNLTFVVLLGDILNFHEKCDSLSFKTATTFIKNLSALTTTYVLIGNHDYINNSQFLTDAHFFNTLKEFENVYIVDKVITQDFQLDNSEPLKFTFLPYVPKGRFMEALNTSEELWELSTAIFCHQEFKGCKMGAIVSQDGDEWPEDNPFVISGHIHNHQIINDNIFYTGTPIQHGFGDNEKKFVWNFEYNIINENLSYSYKKIDLGIKSKKIIYLEFEDIKNFKAEDYKDYNLKIDIKGKSEEFKVFRNSKKYKELISQNILISFTNTNTKTKINELKEKNLSFKNQSYLNIFKSLIDKESETVQKLYQEITN